MQSEVNGIDGAKSIADDIFCKDQASHDRALNEVLQRLRERGLTLNKDKCAFIKSNLDFFGFVFSKQGMSVDRKKVEAICSITPPQNMTELRSLTGLLNYCSKMIPDFATISEPLRELTGSLLSGSGQTVNKLLLI